MDFQEYAERARQTRVYGDGWNLIYPVLGLASEAGEVADKMKKNIRDSSGLVTDEFRSAMCKELGDVLWYVNAVAEDLGLTLEHVATVNTVKLQGRQAAGTVHGSGDDR